MKALLSTVLALTLAAVSIAGPETPARISYDAWNEDIRVDLQTRTLTQSRTEYSYDNPVSGTPSGVHPGVPLERRLSLREVVDLLRLVRRSGFLELGESYGAPEDQRFYPHRLEVEFAGGTRKAVDFRSNPSYEGEPEAFRTLVRRLHELSGAR